MTEQEFPEAESERVEFDAWRKSTNAGETTRIIVGTYWNHPERIEADPEDLITDPDAFEEGVQECDDCRLYFSTDEKLSCHRENYH